MESTHSSVLVNHPPNDNFNYLTTHYSTKDTSVPSATYNKLIQFQPSLYDDLLDFIAQLEENSSFSVELPVIENVPLSRTPVNIIVSSTYNENLPINVYCYVKQTENIEGMNFTDHTLPMIELSQDRYDKPDNNRQQPLEPFYPKDKFKSFLNGITTACTQQSQKGVECVKLYSLISLCDYR